jgi:hypothetical protein
VALAAGTRKALAVPAAATAVAAAMEMRVRRFMISSGAKFWLAGRQAR